jgi:hypothetical protein
MGVPTALSLLKYLLVNVSLQRGVGYLLSKASLVSGHAKLSGYRRYYCTYVIFVQ